MTDMNIRPNPKEDGKTHINTHAKSRSTLGKILSPDYDLGEVFKHPALGSFRTVESMRCWLNTGGNRDNIRQKVPHEARNLMRLAPKFKCNKFRELMIDATILKLETHRSFVQMMIDCDLPFDYYFLHNKLPIRPSVSALYIGIFDEVREILRGNKPHKFMDFTDLEFKPVPDGEE